MALKNMTLKNIADCCGGKLVGGDETLVIAGAVMDSRSVEKDFLFFAIKGERADGHDFIPQAMEKGAACAVCEREPEPPCGAYLLVQDVPRAMQDIAAFYRKELSIPIVGITGSVGKTSTKEMVAEVLAQKYNVLKTQGNYNNELGVPLTLLRIRGEHEAAVIEMGINHFGEMRRLSRMVAPNIVVMTNIGDCHLEALGSREGVLKAKSEIFDYLSKDGTVILNGDDELLSMIRKVHNHATVMYGKNKLNDYYAADIRSKGLFGTEVVIHMPPRSFEVQIPLPGEHMVYNALAAAAAGDMLRLSASEIKAGIEAAKAMAGRGNLVRGRDVVVIDDCYNANPFSMRAAIDLLAEADTRKVAILGDMFELGEHAESLHEDVGRYAAICGIDVILCAGELAAKMAKGAGRETHSDDSGEVIVRHFAGKKELFQELDGLLQPGDAVLVKASHGMGFAEIVEKLK